MPTFRSFAKVNLHLEVARRRPDGFHDLRTIFSTIDLADDLEIVSAPSGVTLEIEGSDLASDGTNLVHRAAMAFLAAWGGLDGVRLRLRKRIPIGGGLGGGSSNAATTLLGMARLAAISPPAEELARVAAELGADVPFFLVGGRALGLERGDAIRPLPDLATPLELWLAVPPFGLSTAAVFAALGKVAERGADERIAVELAGSVPQSVDDAVGQNDLEAPAFALRPELEAVYNRLVRSRARAVRMSGSGSAMFAIFDDPDVARAAGVGLPPGTAWFPARTLGRAEWYRASGFGDPGEGD